MGPELRKQERLVLKFNLDAKRTSLSLVVNTLKHVPHLEWSSERGIGRFSSFAVREIGKSVEY
jgi:hypothetical protein